MSFTAKGWLVRAASLGLLSALGCHDPDDFELSPERVDTIISIVTEDGSSSLPADGFSRLTLLVRITPHAAAGKRTVVLTTSQGTLFAANASGASSEGKSVEVPADSRGEVRAELQSSTTLGSAFVTAGVKDVDGLLASLRIDYVPVVADDVIKFIRSPATAPADGATDSLFAVRISRSIPVGNRQVQWGATVGTFTNTMTEADTNGETSNTLQSPENVGTDRVTATVNGFTRSVAIRFERAHASHLDVVAAEPSVSLAGEPVTITVTLRRDVGKVSVNTGVKFSSKGPNGEVGGVFTSVTRSDANQQITAKFSPEGLPAGLATLTAVADGGARGTTRIRVEP